MSYLYLYLYTYMNSSLNDFSLILYILAALKLCSQSQWS